MSLPAEFELAAACCRWPPGPGKASAVRAAAVGVDWDHFGKVVARHRIEPLALRAIDEAGLSPPPAVLARLKSESASARRYNLILAGECERLQRHLKKAGIDYLFIKGLALASLAYGGIDLKKGWDVDLLVGPEEIDRSTGLLRSLGYRRTLPAEDMRAEAVAAWRAGMKEETWTHGASAVPVELHWSLVDNPRLLPALGLDSPRQQVQVLPGISLPTLADEPLYAYLCVHGASSAWFRLKWIADLQAFVSGRSDAEVERLHHGAVGLGAGRTSALALLLIERLFGRPLTPNLAHLRRNAAARLLVKLALTAMTAGRAVAEPSDSKAGAVAIHSVQALAMPGFGFLGSELKRQAFSPVGALEVRLPKGVRFLYPLLLVPLWLRRRRSKARSKRPSAGA